MNTTNRRIPVDLIVCDLGKEELHFWAGSESEGLLSDDEGNYEELLYLLAQEKQLLKEHIELGFIQRYVCLRSRRFNILYYVECQNF